MKQRLHALGNTWKAAAVIGVLCGLTPFANAADELATEAAVPQMSSVAAPATLSAAPAPQSTLPSLPQGTANIGPQAATGITPPTTETPDLSTEINPGQKAMAAAVADGVTTGLAVSAGGAELNPAITATPLGLIAATGAKIALVKYADHLPVEQKRFTLKATSAVWGGAAVNNLLILLTAPPPIPLIAGVAMGLFTWHHMAGQYEKEDQMIAARQANKVAEKTASTTEVAQATASSGN